MEWFILMLLYILQGVVLGLVGGVHMLMIPHLSTSQHATLGLAGWAPAFKVFIAPVVDSVYSSTLGRRKTWVVGSQYFIAAMMFALSVVCESQDVSLETITVGFGALSVLVSTQDIAVDSWGLQLPAATTTVCSMVGQSLGSFAGDTLFLMLESAGVLTLSVLFLGVTTILLLVPEEPDQDPADRSSVLVTYQNVICVSCLPAVRTLLFCLLTIKMAFGAESLVNISLVTRGVKKQHLSLISRMCDIILPKVVEHLLCCDVTLQTALDAMKYRMMLMMFHYFLLNSMSWFMNAEGNIDGLFYMLMIAIQVCQHLAVNTMKLALTTFFCIISDRRIGAAYCTLLHSCSNFGGLWPTYVVKRIVDKVSLPGCQLPSLGCVIYDPAIAKCDDPCVVVDGLWMVTLTCLSVGIVWFIFAKSFFLQLENFPPAAWQIVTERDQQQNMGRRR